MKYKVGNRVRVKSLEWHNRNKDADGYIHPDAEISFAPSMSKLCGQEFTVAQIAFGGYLFAEDTAHFVYPEYAIEDPVGERINKVAVMYADGLNEEKQSKEYERIQPIPMSDFDVIDLGHNIADKVELILGDYDLKQEGEKWFAVKKKKEYPKSYEECSKIAPMTWGGLTFKHYNELLSSFYRLLVCRDAYWKIAGEEMGSGKPWKPDWNNLSDKYCLYFVSGDAWSKECQTRQCPFAFPTPEMRDAFKENFDADLELCKELL